MTNFLKRYWPETFAGLVTFIAASAVFVFSSIRFANDDQFILYRYVDNLVAGHGFVYNIGERVLGSTTPLFTLVCAGFKFLFPFVPTPSLVAALNIFFLSVSAVFFYKVSRLFLSQNFALLTVLIYALNLSRTIPEGMETPLFLLTLFAFLYYLFTEKWYLSSIFLSLTLLTRPDAGLIAVLVALYWWQKVGWQKALRLIILCVAVALPWLIFSTWYFGSFVPQSLATKLHSRNIYHLSRLQAAKIQFAALSRIYWGRWFDPDNLFLQTICNLLPLLILMTVGFWKKFTNNTWILFAIPIVYFISFSISNPIIFPWYLSEMEPFWILVSFFGLSVLLQKKLSLWFILIICVVILSGPFYSWGRLIMAQDQGSKTDYFDIASYIKAQTLSPNKKIGLADIGVIGYYTHAYIVDFIGLVNNTSVDYYPVKDLCGNRERLYEIPPRLIINTQPAWLVASTSQMESCFLMSVWFSAHYTAVYSNKTAIVWKSY